MNDVLLILHFIGLGMGFSASVGNVIIMRLIQASPKDMPVLGRFPPIAAKVGASGLVILLITGPIMLYTKYNGAWGALSWTFAAKLVFVAILTIMVILLEMTMSQVRKGNLAVAARLPIYGRIAGVSLLLVIIFAVITFNVD